MPTKDEYKILKVISKRQPISAERINKKVKSKNINAELQSLCKLISLDYTGGSDDYGLPLHTGKYILTREGKMCLEENKNVKLKFWLPIVINSLISIAAIIISILALLKQQPPQP